ncbi:MAG: hypothetical protein JXQ87_02275 [Bacteroidia bacterium]
MKSFIFSILISVPLFGNSQSWERITLNVSPTLGFGEKKSPEIRDGNSFLTAGIGYHFYLNNKFLLNPTVGYCINELNGKQSSGIDLSINSLLALKQRFNTHMFLAFSYYHDMNMNPNSLCLSVGFGITPWAKYDNEEDESWQGQMLIAQIGPAFIFQEDLYFGFKMSWINCLGNTIPRKQT